MEASLRLRPLVFWQRTPARPLSLFLLNLFHEAQSLIQEKDRVIDQQVDKSQEQRRLLILNVSLSLLGELSELIFERINLPDVFDDVIHRPSVAELLFELHTVPGLLDAYEHVEDGRGDPHAVLVVAEHGLALVAAEDVGLALDLVTR